MNKICLIAVLTAGLIACSRQQPDQVNRTGGESNTAAQAASSGSAQAKADSDAALVVSKNYAAAIGKGDFTTAATYWRDPSQAAQFAADLEDYAKVKASAGGSATLTGEDATLPLTLDLTLRSGSPYQMQCVVKLSKDAKAPQPWLIQSIDC